MNVGNAISDTKEEKEILLGTEDEFTLSLFLFEEEDAAFISQLGRKSPYSLFPSLLLPPSLPPSPSLPRPLLLL